jgi:hypothetical protein
VLTAIRHTSIAGVKHRSATLGAAPLGLGYAVIVYAMRYERSTSTIVFGGRSGKAGWSIDLSVIMYHMRRTLLGAAS